MRWVLAALLVLVQQQQAVQPPPERGVDLVSIDFIALGADGRPITDLKAEEVSVRVAGRARAVRALQMISTSAPAPSQDAAGLPAPYGSNTEGAGGRALILVLDEDSFRPGRENQLRESLGRIITTMGANDRLALATIPLGGLRVPLTTDRARVQSALNGLAGRASSTETGSDLACRTRTTLGSLASLLESRFGFREAPATIVFVTGGLAAPRRDNAMALAPGRCELKVEDYRRVADAAAAARAHFYVVQMNDLSSDAPRLQSESIAGAGYKGSDNPIEGIEHLAGVTGGLQVNLTGADGGALERVMRETSSYYSATLDPLPSDRTGRAQTLEVRVSRPGVTVRSRPSLALAKADTTARSLANPTPRDMLSTTLEFADLPLRAAAFTSLDPDGKTLRVTTMAEPVDPMVKLTSLVAALFDQEGKVVANFVATPRELEASPVLGALQVPPGGYRLRVAAIDSTGRAGTADYGLDAGLVQTGTLRLSDVVLGLSRAGAFVPRLEFGSEPVATGYLELYGAAPGSKVGAVIEISKTANGPAMLSQPLAITATGTSRYVAKGAIPIGALPPGDYAVRAIVAIDGHPPTRVTRTLRKR